MNKTILRTITLILVTVMLSLALVGCGEAPEQAVDPSATQAPAVNDEATQPSATPAPADEEVEVELGLYEGVEYTPVEALEVTDEDVAEMIDLYMNDYAELVEVDRAAKEGDTVNIDYVGTIDGVAFSGGTAQGYDLVLGSNTFIKGFEEGLIGVVKGDKRDVTCTFPDPYPKNPDLAGVEAVFACTVNAVQEKSVPECTDEFVSTKLGFENVAAFEEFVRSALIDEAQTAAEQSNINQIITKVINSSNVTKYPVSDANQVREKYINNYETQAVQYGFSDLQSFVEAMGSDYEEFMDYLELNCANHIRGNLVIEAVADELGITVSEEELDIERVKYANEKGYETLSDFEYYNGMTVDEHHLQNVAYYDKYTFPYYARLQKTVDYIVEHAVAVEADEVDTEAEPEA